MGNRAFIQFGTGTGKENPKQTGVGVYMHWNGGRDTIDPLLKVARELKKESSKAANINVGKDIDNFVFLARSRGFSPEITPYKPDPKLGYDESWIGIGDNGLYEVHDLKIVNRRTYKGEKVVEQKVHDPKEMAQSIRSSVSDTFIEADDWHKEHFPKEKAAREKAAAQREKDEKEFFKNLNKKAAKEKAAKDTFILSIAQTTKEKKEKEDKEKAESKSDFDKIMSKKNPKYKNLSVFLVGEAFAEYRKDPKKFEADLENRTQQFKLKSKIKEAVERSKSFKMPKAKSKKGGAMDAGLGFELKRR